MFQIPNQLVKILDRDLAVAGIAKKDERGRSIDVHALRHTFCTWGQEAGITPRELQAAMRHKKADLTHSTYTHLDESKSRRALDKLPQVQLKGAGVVPQGQLVSIQTGADFCLHQSLHQTVSPSDFLGQLLAELGKLPKVLENEKTLKFIEKTRAFVSEVDGGRTRNLRIDSPVL